MSFYSNPRSGMRRLADDITEQIGIWENYHRQSGIPLEPFGFDDAPDPSPQTPRPVLDARDKIIDSAFKLLQLVAGPSKIISIALSYSQTISAINWLLHFKIFNLVPEKGLSYDELAESANVPINELKRMIRMAIANSIFSEQSREWVEHTAFSRAFTQNENLKHGIPFFCDVVMPAAAKMTDATIRWPDSEESDETARNMALDDDTTFAQFLTENNQADGYSSLMRLLGSEPSPQAVSLADIVHEFDWSSLEEDSLVVDVGSCGPYSWQLAELFPHLRFQVQGPQDKLNVMKDFVKLKNPELLTRIEFCPHDFHDEQITHDARVYLLAGIIQHMPDDEVEGILGNIADVIRSDSNSIVIVDTMLSEVGYASLAMQKEGRCLDMTIRQLHNSGYRTPEELRELAAVGCRLFELNQDTQSLPGSKVITVVLEASRMGRRLM
ncbi:hypothetical protein ACHAQJ_010228 [Trichoderma viride]